MTVAKPRLTEAQILLMEHLLELRFCRRDEIEFEYKFCAERKWRADLALPGNAYKMLFECDGGKFRGGHRRGNALEADYERQNWAQANGWAIYRFTNEQILTGKAKKWIQENLL